MGEAIVARGASIGSASGGSGYVFMTEIITEDKVWVAPDAQNQQFSVRIFGGGGAGTAGDQYNSAGGGSGWMNNGIFTIPVATSISIAIGHGGIGANDTGIGCNGGTTAFGGYLSANGGGCAQTHWLGGHGGAGGGALGHGGGNGGNGYQFGGGGGGYKGGNGGMWGGGGGCANSRGTPGKGGTYGGNGCRYDGTGATNGTNTMGYSNIEYGARGMGICNSYGGGGGYGGCGGGSYGGGGGFGGNGGSNCGGGGGYMGHGGDNAGGGGGYGCGGDGIFSNSGTPRSFGIDGKYGGGGGWQSDNSGYTTNWYGGNGGDGICIIQYYKAIQQSSFTMYQ